MAQIKVFISSVQAEFSEERRKLCDYIRQDALLRRYFIPFLFEDQPANDHSAQRVYLDEATNCDIYIGIFGIEYGYQDEYGISPTEREFDAASNANKHRLIYIKQTQGHDRKPKEQALIKKAESLVVRKAFADYYDLQLAVYESLVRYLEEFDYLRMLSFDSTLHPTATIDDIDYDKVDLFVQIAKNKRNFPITIEASLERVLMSLDLMTEDGRLANAALLLFAKHPQRFFSNSEVKCVQFYGNTIVKPVPSQQIFRGSIFEVIDQAVAFVMSRIDNRVGTRNNAASVDVSHELPLEAVTEAIVNACVHRTYISNASVQVMLFTDRLEIWNPGTLPFGLTVEKLKEPHHSIPTNPTLAHPVYLCGYIDKVGTGTGDIVEKCKEYGLKEPEFIQDTDFKTIIWRAKSNGADVKSNVADDKSNGANAKSNVVGDKSNGANAKSNEVKLSKKQQKVIEFCKDTPRRSNEIFEMLGIKNQRKSFVTYISTLIELDKIRPVIVDKPTSPNQKYISVVK